MLLRHPAIRLLAFVCAWLALLALVSQPAAGLVFLFLTVFFFFLGLAECISSPFVPIVSKALPVRYLQFFAPGLPQLSSPF